MSPVAERLKRLSEHVRRGLDPEAHVPLLPQVDLTRALASWVVPAEELARVDTMPLRDQGHGFDPFGMSRDGLAMGLLITHFLYHRWFRVTSHGIEHLPADGPVVLAANHSGTLPLDGLMICGDILRKAPHPRVPRAVVDYFVAQAPFVNEVFTRAGAIGGSRGNFHELLSNGEMLLVFPEGTRGIGKGWDKRYQLQRWTEGHAELAIRHQAAIVPIGVVGAEEQMPQLAKIPGIHAFGSPYLPIPMTLLPLPVHIHVWYGPPIQVAGVYRPDQADDPDVVADLAQRVKQEVDALLRKGLRARRGIFR